MSKARKKTTSRDTLGLPAPKTGLARSAATEQRKPLFASHYFFSQLSVRQTSNAFGVALVFACFKGKKKNQTSRGALGCWCRRRDLNPHVVANNGF